jgi:hypothetical protein
LGESLNKEKSKFDDLSIKDKVNIFKKVAEARKALDGVDVAIQLNQLQNQISKEEALRYLDGIERETNKDSNGDDTIDISPDGQGSGEKTPA